MQTFKYHFIIFTKLSGIVVKLRNYYFIFSRHSLTHHFFFLVLHQNEKNGRNTKVRSSCKYIIIYKTNKQYHYWWLCDHLNINIIYYTIRVGRDVNEYVIIIYYYYLIFFVCLYAYLLYIGIYDTYHSKVTTTARLRWNVHSLLCT